MNLPIYLDYMATTPVEPQVIESMLTCLGREGQFGNPASQTHHFGWEAAQRVEQARAQVAALIQADPQEIVWTSGATEANNLALKGAAYFYQRQGKHIITMATEHKAVLDSCAYLQSQGFEITYLHPNENGILDISLLADNIRDDTLLISIMHVNNETGVIQDIASIAQLVKAKGILFHCDAVQSAGKIPLDITKIPIDLLSLSGHKLYGPKGVGALYVRRNPRVRLAPQMHGGEQEQGLRSGTLATHQIVGMGKAFELAKKYFSKDTQHYEKLTQTLWHGLSKLEDIEINGDLVQRVPNCLNIHFSNVNKEMLIASLPEIAVSGGSACNSAKQQPSHVLLGMHLSRQRAQESIRFSVGRFTTLEEIEFALEKITTRVKQLRAISSEKI